jgi:hypothetical protein
MKCEGGFPGTFRLKRNRAAGCGRGGTGAGGTGGWRASGWRASGLAGLGLAGLGAPMAVAISAGAHGMAFACSL